MSFKDPDSPAATGEKLQKILAHSGLGSRREMETWIEAGRVSVDGKIVSLGKRVTSSQTIRVDGKVISTARLQPRRKIIIYHKPEGEVCTRSDPRGRPTVFDRLPQIRGGRWISVGRLDFNTSGLLLFTNDGELANLLMHPRYGIEREYAVRVAGNVNHEKITALKNGVELEDGMAKFQSIQDIGGEGTNHWYHVILTEGRNREVRRMWEHVGAKVSRLTRIRFGMLTLPRKIRAGRWMHLPDDETRQLLKLVGMNSDKSEQASDRSRNKTGRSRSTRPGSRTRHSGHRKK
ncbi:MAG: 23S rRNA pseudouridine(2605) synthase RluB [Acidiferrobacterales bacterium]